MTPLRQKMINDMKLRRFSTSTQQAYVDAVAGLARFFNQSPDRLNEENIQAYLLHLMEERKLFRSPCNVAISGLPFFYGKTLFKSVSQTVLQFGKNPKNGLGGKLGFIAIFHTWDQTLMDHFHLHVVIPGGALSFDNDRWIAGREDFLFHVKALSQVFQGKFMRRFLLHVLPDGFMRIRHFGFLANRCKKQSLGRCREILGLTAETSASLAGGIQRPDVDGWFSRAFKPQNQP
ncbi:MAG: transposase, partial [Desulfobacterales bacterium]|nr:transposase [Desulfobacterales bacterium]